LRSWVWAQAAPEVRRRAAAPTHAARDRLGECTEHAFASRRMREVVRLGWRIDEAPTGKFGGERGQRYTISFERSGSTLRFSTTLEIRLIAFQGTKSSSSSRLPEYNEPRILCWCRCRKSFFLNRYADTVLLCRAPVLK
jgi:hypothetical protein